jgi:hypothetical protein
MNIKCRSCDNEAEIFHDEGDFCVYCWNEIKETPNYKRNAIVFTE